MWFIGDEGGQETSAPPAKKILDPPLGQQVYLSILFEYIILLSVKPVEEKKLLPFLMTVMKTAESFQATYVATSVPKTVSLLKENQ